MSLRSAGQVHLPDVCLDPCIATQRKDTETAARCCLPDDAPGVFRRDSRGRQRRSPAASDE